MHTPPLQLYVCKHLSDPVQGVSSGALAVVQVPLEPQTPTRQGFEGFGHDPALQQTLFVQNTCPEGRGAQSAALVQFPPGCCPVPQ